MTLRDLHTGECLPLWASVRDRSSNPTAQPAYAKSALACLACALLSMRLFRPDFLLTAHKFETCQHLLAPAPEVGHLRAND